jgi:hypothetical protein
VAKYHPEDIEYEVRGKNVIVKNIGGKAGRTHNLLQLAEHVGIFSKDYTIFKYDSDYLSLKQVLLHLSDVIKWAARYPISNNTATIFVLSKDVPSILVNGFHILDVMQPLFDLFDKEMN